MTTHSESASRRQLKSLELFTGAGGLALGTHNAGFRHVALVEWNKDGCETIRQNISAGCLSGVKNANVLQEDARLLDFAGFGALDLVAGGPPCQPFSIGGKHRGRMDERDMIPQFIRAVRETAPRAFILENVKGLTRQTFRNYLSYVQLCLTYPVVVRRPRETWLRHLSRLEDLHTRGGFPDLHYNVVLRLLNAANFGIPQTRERVFIVGFRADVRADWHFPEATHSLRALLHDQWVTGAYWERHDMRAPKNIRPAGRFRMPSLTGPPPTEAKPWATLRDAIAGLPTPRTDRDAPGVLNHRVQPGARTYVGHTGSPLDLPAKTLKAGVHGVPGGENMIVFNDGSVRYLTVREAARVQTFPDSWRFLGPWSEIMRQLGNAVPVELARLVAGSVAQKLRESDG